MIAKGEKFVSSVFSPRFGKLVIDAMWRDAYRASNERRAAGTVKQKERQTLTGRSVLSACTQTYENSTEQIAILFAGPAVSTYNHYHLLIPSGLTATVA